MIYLKLFEDYNNNKFNELVVKYFNNYSEEIIDITSTFSKLSDVPKIMKKISFILETPGEVETLYIKDKIIAYFIDMKDEDVKTIFFDTRNKEFLVTSYRNFIKTL